MRWVKPSNATVSPSRMVDSTASARERKRGMEHFPCATIAGLFTGHARQGQIAGASGAGVSRAQTLVCAGALQTPISGLPEIGTQWCPSRLEPTWVDRYRLCRARLA